MVILGVDINIHNKWIQVQIDQREVWAQKGSKDFVRLEADAAQEARQTVLSGIARRAQEGDSLANAPEGKAREVIANIAWSNSATNYEITIESVPKQPPKIYFVGGLQITTEWLSLGQNLDFRG